MQDRVRVLLRVGDPGHRIDQRQQRLHAGSVFGGDGVGIGQVDDGDRAEVRRPRARASPVHRSHSSSGTRSSRSVRGIHAIGWAVVGRRAEAGLTSPPASALSKLDLPTPVPPTSARTYASPGKPRRRVPAAWAARRGSLSRPSWSAASAASSAAARHGESGSDRQHRRCDRRRRDGLDGRCHADTADSARTSRRRCSHVVREIRKLLGRRQVRVEPRALRRERAASTAWSCCRACWIDSTMAASPNSADSSFWLRNAVAAATPTSAPVRPPVWRNVRKHHAGARGR